MSSRLSWRSLVPGLIALFVLIGITVGVLAFAGVNQIRGETIRIHLLAGQARGVMRGTEVWLAGQRVGIVERVAFTPVSADSGERVLITAKVRRRDAGQIRRDSEVELRTGANLVGPMVVAMSAGTPASAAIRDGDTLRAVRHTDLELTRERLAGATQHVEPIVANVRTVLGHVRDGDGTVGAALRDQRTGNGALTREASRLFGQVASLRARMAQRDRNGEGAADLASVMTGARIALARVDSIRALLASPGTSLGRFRRDSTLSMTIAEVRDELGRLRTRLDDNTGTLGRWRADSAVTRAVSDAQAEMALLFADVRRRPFRYIHF